MNKFKIIAVIFSLCITLTAFAVGVYAATSVTYKISGNMVYDFNEVMVNVSSKLSKITGLTKKSSAQTVLTDIQNKSPTTISTLSFKTYEYSGGKNVATVPKITTSASGAYVDSSNIVKDARTMNFDISFVYKYEITITTPAGSGVVINYALPTLPAGKTSVFVVPAGSGNVSSNTRISVGETAKIVYYVGLNSDLQDFNDDLTAGNISFSN